MKRFAGPPAVDAGASQVPEAVSKGFPRHNGSYSSSRLALPLFVSLHPKKHASQVKMHLARRLTANEPNRMEAFRLESDIVENVKRIYYFAKRIAAELNS